LADFHSIRSRSVDLAEKSHLNIRQAVRFVYSSPLIMLHTRSLLILACLAAVFPTLAAARPWKNADATRTIEGDFVKRDANTVTILLDSGKETRFDVAKLHADDKKWLDLNHPASGETPPDAAAVFDTLKFGDKHPEVLAKLKASKFVEMTIADDLIGRTGLNGIFRIRQKIGGQHASLYFDWSESEALKEITIRTAVFPASSFDAQLAPCWEEFVKLLTTLHGKPIQEAPRIDPKSVPSGAMLASHLWKLESGGSALLGVGCEGTDYQVVVRFTEEKIEPVALTRPAKPGGLNLDFDP
jgi:hypothetical protein